MKKSELVFIPSPGAGHLISTVESAKLLVDHNDRLSITILIMKFPFDKKVTTYTESLAASNLSSRIKFITLPDDQPDKESPHSKDSFNSFMENKKPQVKEAVSKLTESPDSPPLAGFVLDMFCTCMIDVANELQVPSYIFFTSSAAFLGFLFQVQALNDEENIVITELKDSDAVLEIPSLMNSVPSKVWPTVLFQKEWVGMLYELARRFRGVKGIIVNTFEELESYALRSFPSGRSKTPPVYAVGPILNIKGENYDLGSGGGADKKADIMTWLDDQPESSVVFLCFGSMGSFGEDQIKEIACALEQSGHRFLWSLRRAPSKDKKFEMPSDYTDTTEVLPEGFFDRTAKIGKVIGWAPQVDVLRHPAVGGFVSHCGWNSTLESIWFGVPIATWPIYAEQQFNAFELVVELGLAVEIRMDYRQDFTVDNPTVVSAQEIERGIGCLMERNSEMRKRVKEMSEKARKTLMDGGSSFSSVARLIDDIFDNIA